MKKLKTNGLLLCALLILVLTSCKKTEYTNAIPADVAAVVSVDLKSVAQKSGINDESNATLKQHLTDALKNGLNSETSEQLSKIMDDPSESGFDFEKPVYVYTAKEFGYSPVIDLSVCSKGDLTSTVEALSKSQICTELEKAKDYKFTIVGGKAILAFNRGTALFVQAKEGMTNELHMALDKVMAQKKDQSFRSNDAFDDLKDRKGDVSFYMSAGSNSTLINQKGSDLAFIGDMNFENGRILLKLEKYKAKKEDNTSASPKSSFLPVSNALLANLPQRLPLMFTIGMNGAEAYEELSAGSMSDMFDIPIVQKLFATIKGDLTLGFDAFGKKEPTFLAYAQIQSAAAVQEIYGFVKSQKDDTFGSINKRSANDYVYSFAKKNIYYGVIGNLLYITNDASLVHYKVSGGTYAQNAYAPQAKGKSLFFVFDASQLEYAPALKQKFGPVISSAIEKNVICLRGYNTATDAWNVEMICKDKQTNTLKQIINIARQIIGI